MPAMIAERRLRVWQLIHQYATDPRHGPGSIKELCQESGVSERTLRNVCHQFAGVAIRTYIRRHRLRLARELLQRAQPGETTVTHIATFCGFNHLSRFSGAMREHHGELPSLILQRGTG